MPKSFRAHRVAIAAMVASFTFGVVLPAATPEPNLQELEEAVVIGNAVWPLRDYVDFPRYDSVVISPDGRHIATGWCEDSYQRRLAIIDFPSLRPAGSRELQQHFGVADLRWLDESRLLVQPDWPLRGLRRLREPLGTMLVTNIDGRILHELNAVAAGTLDAFAGRRTREANALRTKKGTNAYGPVRAIAMRTSETGQLLFQTLWAGGVGSRSFGIFQLDLRTGKQNRVAALPLRAGKVVTGPGQRVALVAGPNTQDEQVVYYLPEEERIAGSDWQVVARSRAGERGLLPVAWTGAGEEYYALDGRDLPTRAVVVWDARSNTQRLLYRHPDADMDQVSLDPAGRPWMFSGVHHYPVYWYPDPAHPLARLHHALVQRLDDDYIDIVNATDDLSTAVVSISSGRRPTLFLVVDVKAVKSLTGMDSFPKLRGRRLSPVRAIEFAARDGLKIRGYLTTPLDKDGEPRRGVPLLVMAHNGPRGEPADYRYDVERQLFASRGYAVLQVNARGSGGRGAAFEQAGDGKWGREVQDDYADAARWAIRDGVAAAGKTCFYGTRYGAYSAMMAAARNPGLFECIIGVAGVYDLPAMVADAEPTDKEPAMLKRAFGGTPEELRSRSPVNHAASIKAKVLLLNQHLDNSVPRTQAVMMASALRAAGNRPREQTVGTEAEGYLEPGSRTFAYSRMIAFLDEQTRQ